MVKTPRKAYTLELKQEAVRPVESGRRISEAARSLGVVEQTLSNWVRAHRAVKLRGLGNRSELTAEQMEIRQLRANRCEWRWSATSWEKPGVLCEGPEVRFAFIARHRSVWPACVQCRVLGVSATCYHQHRLRRRKVAQCQRQLKNGSSAHLVKQIAIGWCMAAG
jgi:transposase